MKNVFLVATLVIGTMLIVNAKSQSESANNGNEMSNVLGVRVQKSGMLLSGLIPPVRPPHPPTKPDSGILEDLNQPDQPFAA